MLDWEIMSKRADLKKVGAINTWIVTPARHIPKLAKVSAATGASIIMLFDTIPQDNIVAMVIAIAVTGIAFLAINYLAEFRDWKYKHQLEYEEQLNKLGGKAVKPNLSFSYIYIISLLVSLALVGVIAVFFVPILVKSFVFDPTLVNEPTTYFTVALIFTSVFALFVDKKICRPLADGSFKAKESELEDKVIEDLEAQFQNGGTVGLSSEAQAKLMAAIAEALKKQ